MIPMGRLSTVAAPAPFQDPDSLNTPNFLTAYEQGGVDLSDASQGLLVKRWTATYNAETGAIDLSAPGVPQTTIFTALGVTELDLAFDQNMRPFFTYVQDGQAKFRWYDTVLGANRITDLNVADYNPRCCLDDKREMQTSLGSNDIILAYMRGGSLYYRQQRDRYENEYLLYAGVNAKFLRMGMSKTYRLQFYFEGILGG